MTTQLKSQKSEFLQKYQRGPQDTGSSEVQVASLTRRINSLHNHFSAHKKDFHSNRGLINLVGQRKRLLAYLKRKNELGYLKLIRALKLRK